MLNNTTQSINTAELNHSPGRISRILQELLKQFENISIGFAVIFYLCEPIFTHFEEEIVILLKDALLSHPIRPVKVIFSQQRKEKNKKRSVTF